jgi:ATP-binding cassette subfamily B protein
MSLFGKQNQAGDRPRFYRFKKFFSFYKPYRLLFAADVFCASMTALAALALPLCIRYITVEVLALSMAEAAPLVFRTVGVMLVLVVVQAACGVFYDNRGHAMGAMIERDMRNELFNHCQKLPVRFFDGEKTGALMSRITGDLFNMAEFCHHGPENLFIFCANFIGAFVVLFRIDARLTLIVFALLPLMIIYTFFFQGRLRRAYRENRVKIASLNAVLEDTLAGIRVVKSFVNEKLEDEKFRKANEIFCRGRMNIFRNEAFYYSVMEFFLAPLIIVGAAAAGSIFISRSILTAPDLIVFLLYIGYLTAPLTKIAQWIGQFQDAIAGFSRFMEIMEKEPEFPEEAVKRNAPNDTRRMYGHLEFINASFRYGEELENVLENISLEIRPGESVALAGSSGVGKTTLCSLIPRFYELTAGKILLDGTDIRKMDLGALRRNIGVVAQDVYLFDGTVLENIRYGKPGAAPEEVAEAAKRANAHEFIMGLPKAYETEIGQRGIRLSGGQRQRLSIARMFLKNPPVLILDEATSALDYESERLVHESLDNFMKDRTTLIVAHRLSTIRKAKRIISLTGRGVEVLDKNDLNENLEL